MELHIEWNRTIRLRRDKKLDYNVDLTKLSKKAGIYIFGRRWGKSFEALYVGKADEIRSRVKGQFNNHKLMQHIKYAKDGRRVIISGIFNAKPGQQQERCLKIIEKALIRYFLAKGDDLVNIHGIRIRQYKITSTGKQPRKIIPGYLAVSRN
jgi:hypothetical protein